MAQQQPQINVSTDTTNSTQFIVYGVVALAVVGLAYFGIIKPILNAIGLTRDKVDRQGDNDYAKLSRQQVLSPQLYRENKNLITISSGSANESAYNIWRGKGLFWDNEDLGVGSITSAGSLVNISYIAYIFDANYGESMESYLQRYLEPEDWIIIDNYVDKTKRF
jgi:hypothetical protein